MNTRRKGAVNQRQLADMYKPNPDTIVERLRRTYGTTPPLPNSLEAANEIERLRGEIKRLRHERDVLADSIRDAAVKAHMIKPDAALTGPMLIMLCDGLADIAELSLPAFSPMGTSE